MTKRLPRCDWRLVHQSIQENQSMVRLNSQDRFVPGLAARHQECGFLPRTLTEAEHSAASALPSETSKPIV